MLVHALSFRCQFHSATVQSSHNSEIYNIGAHAQWLRVNHETMTMERVTFGL